jgi:mxaK protein
MNRRLQILQWALIFALLGGTVAAADFAYKLWNISQVNAYIDAPILDQKAPQQAQALLAKANALVEHDDAQQATDVLTRLITLSDSEHIKAIGYYNRANINLRHAMTLDAKDNKRIPVIELAKQDYRTAINLDSALWDARYNLEMALRMVPEEPDPNAFFDKKTMGSERSIETKAFRVDLP